MCGDSWATISSDVGGRRRLVLVTPWDRSGGLPSAEALGRSQPRPGRPVSPHGLWQRTPSRRPGPRAALCSACLVLWARHSLYLMLDV